MTPILLNTPSKLVRLLLRMVGDIYRQAIGDKYSGGIVMIDTSHMLSYSGID